MHLRTGLQAAVAILFCQTAVANPIVTPRSPSPAELAPVRMSASDSFSNSGTDFDTWAQRMVDEGKMWSPEKSSFSVPTKKPKTEVVRHEDGGLSLRQTDPIGRFIIHSIKCGGLAIPGVSFDFGRKQYCNMMAGALNLGGIKVGAMIASHVLCNETQDCTLWFELGAQFIVWRKFADEFDEFCSNAWLELWEHCKGLGGAAKITFKEDPSEGCGLPVCGGPWGLGVEMGTMEGIAYPQDSGATCPANTEERVCKKFDGLG